MVAGRQSACGRPSHGVREGGSRCPCRTGVAMLNRRRFISGAIASSGLLPTLARAESRPTPSYPVLAGLTPGLLAERQIAGAAFALGRPLYPPDFLALGFSPPTRGLFLTPHLTFSHDESC